MRGIKICFPYRPYPSQLQYIEKVLMSLEDKQNALLESPTGTGKTLCLLTSIIAYQQNHPNIQLIYLTKMHTQIKQMVSQLKKTIYKPKITCLGSRAKFCINEELDKDDYRNLNFECKNLCFKGQCQYMERGIQLANAYDFQLRDIEDLREYGVQGGGCPYFMSQNLIQKSEVIFAPYAYGLIQELLDKFKQLNKRIVIVFDEAHNVDIQSDTFQSFRRGIKECEEILDLTENDGELKNNIQDKIDELRQSGQSENRYLLNKMSVDLEINQQRIDTIYEVNNRIIHNLLYYWNYYQTEREDRIGQIVLKGFGGQGPQIEEYIFNEGYRFQNVKNYLQVAQEFYDWYKKYLGELVLPIEQYIMFLQNFKKIQQSRTTYNLFFGNTQSEERSYFKLQCFEPKLIFKYIHQQLKINSVILTSGSIAPLETWEDSLGIPFENTMQSSHVISQNQVKGFIIAKYTREQIFEFSHRIREDPQQLSVMHKNLAKMLIDQIKEIPNGVVLFFNSRKLLNKCLIIWNESGDLERLRNIKDIRAEPKSMQDINQVFRSYRNLARTDRGCILLATARGRLAEGIDFKDKLARAIYLIGCPNLSKKEKYVSQKQRYLNFTMQNERAGDEWYNSQNIKTMNQCLGRVIRHKNDYGTVFLVDNRFMQDKYRDEISEWISPRVTAILQRSQRNKIPQKLRRFYNQNRHLQRDEEDEYDQQSEIGIDYGNGLLEDNDSSVGQGGNIEDL